MDTKPKQSSTLNPLEAEFAKNAATRRYRDSLNTLLTSALGDSSSKAKDISPEKIGPSLSPSVPLTHPLSCEYCLQQITKSPSPQRPDIPLGQSGMASYMQLENVFQRNGYSRDGEPVETKGIFQPSQWIAGVVPPTLPPIGGPVKAPKDETEQASLKAETYDDGKAPLANVPWEAVEAMAKVQAYGHKKYKDFNNYRKGMEVMRNLSCALRHIKSWIEGQDTDPESNESHLAHAMCRVAFTLQNIADGTAIDDRYKSKGAP